MTFSRRSVIAVKGLKEAMKLKSFIQNVSRHEIKATAVEDAFRHEDDTNLEMHE